MITGLRLTTIKIYIDKMFKPFQKRTSTFKSVGSFLFPVSYCSLNVISPVEASMPSTIASDSR